MSRPYTARRGEFRFNCMKTRAYVLAAALVLFVALPLRADEYGALDQRAQQLDNWQARVDASYAPAPATIVSRETSVPVATLQEQQTRTHLGYGGLLIANSLASETGRSFDEIVAMKTDEHGWGSIARENNVNLGAMVSRMDRADADFKKIKHNGKKGHRHGKGHRKGHRGGKGKGGKHH